MANSEKLLRLLKIITLIQAKHYLNAKDLARECEVTERTIYRDLEALNMANLPIYFDPETSGYRFTEKFLLKPLTLTIEEALGLIISSQVLAQQKGTPFEEAVKSAQNKILAVLPDQRKTILNALKGRVQINLPMTVDYSALSDVFEKIEDAIYYSEQIKILYHSQGRNETTERLVDPYALMCRGNAWYLVGFCYQRKDIIMFRIDRIKELTSTKEKFALPADFSLEEYMAGSWQVERGQQTQVKIRFSKVAARWVKEGSFHASQVIEELPDGGVIFTVMVSGTAEIKRWILGYGAEAEVLEPQELREELGRISKDLVGVYSGRL